MGTPGLGVQEGGYPEQGTWNVSFGWRYQKSDRHFVGSEHQVNRDVERSQFINTLNMADINIRYQATKRVELGFGVPFIMATRNQPLRDAQRNILERFQTQARGLGDIVFSARRWIFDPETHLSGNLQLGIGAKLPTGANNVTDTFRTLSGTTISNVVRAVDQSIQPGDGGFGIMVDFNTFKSLAGGVAVFGSGAYLSNPQETNKVLTGSGTRVMSIADQFLLRGGAAFPLPRTKNISVSAGLRVEGVPSRDLIGSDGGFRRPGVAVSVEPAVTIVKGRNAVTLGVPFAIYRNRFVSVLDEASGGHGDAAFADYLVMVGFNRRF